MTLLTQVMDRPLDPGYAAAAERRRAAGEPASRGDRSARTLALLVVLGVLLTAAGLQAKGQTNSPSRRSGASLTESVSWVWSPVRWRW